MVFSFLFCQNNKLNDQFSRKMLIFYKSDGDGHNNSHLECCVTLISVLLFRVVSSYKVTHPTHDDFQLYFSLHALNYIVT